MTPRFTVVVPTRARPQRLAACLEALAQLDYHREQFEVIVVDDGGGSDLEDVGARHREALGLRIIRQPHQGPAAARNRGARHARTPWLAFTDDDCRPAPDWLKVLERRLGATPAAAVGGLTVSSATGDAYAEAGQLLRDHVLAHFNPPGAVTFLASSNLALATEGFRAIGGFDESFPLAAAEDRGFCDRWIERGFTIEVAPEAVVHHHHPFTLGSFLGQNFRYGRGAYHYHGSRARRGRGPLRVEGPRFYWDLLARAPRERRARMGLLLLVSQVANAAGFAMEAGRALRARRA